MGGAGKTLGSPLILNFDFRRSEVWNVSEQPFNCDRQSSLGMYLAKNQQEGAQPDSSTRVLNDWKFKSKGLIQEDYNCYAMESLFPYNPLEFRVASSLASGIELGAHRAVCTRRFRFMHR
jgi:hypothetical protein